MDLPNPLYITNSTGEWAPSRKTKIPNEPWSENEPFGVRTRSNDFLVPLSVPVCYFKYYSLGKENDSKSDALRVLGEFSYETSPVTYKV